MIIVVVSGYKSVTHYDFSKEALDWNSLGMRHVGRLKRTGRRTAVEEAGQ